MNTPKASRRPSNLDLADFHCRFVIIPHEEDALIPPIESAIIKEYNPLWNTWVDGFGNHDPGSGRYKQARSQWDTIHRGRKWADKLEGPDDESSPNVVKENILAYAKRLKKDETNEL